MAKGYSIDFTFTYWIEIKPTSFLFYSQVNSMNSPVNTEYDLLMVALSLIFAVIGSFIALTAATRVTTRNGRQSLSQVATVGLALGGIGIWSMHFVGMLALKMDVGSSYSMLETVVSLAVVVAASAFSVSFAARSPENLARLLAAGFMLGMSVVVMHYLGMFGLKFEGYIRWDYGVVLLSMAIAVVAATAALWLTFHTPTVARRVVAALVMGVAVSAMHYTGMTAAEFICTTENRTAIPQGAGYVSAFRLPSLVIAVTTLLLMLLALDQGFHALRQRLGSQGQPQVR